MSDIMRPGIPRTDPSILRLGLIGPMHALTLDNTNVLPAGRKTRGLLAIIAMAGRRPVLRSKLAELLWSRRSEEQARASLRQEIHRLQDALAPVGAPVLEIERHSVALRPGLTAVDAERLLNSSVNQIISLAGAQQLTYTGASAVSVNGLPPLDAVLLEELNGTDPALDAWLTAERRRLKEHARALFEAALQQRPEPMAAVAICQHLLMLDPLHESAWRELIRCQLMLDQRVAALESGERCEAAMARHGSPPAPEISRMLACLRGAAETPAPWERAREAVIAPIETPSERGRPRLTSTPDPDNETDFALARLAVLPALEAGADHRAELQEYPPGGSLRAILAEELVAGLAQHPLISVIGGPVIAQAIARGRDDAQLRHDLGLDYVLDGTLMRGREKLRIIIQLRDLRWQSQIVWARRFETDAASADAEGATDRFAEIAAMVGAQLPWELLLIESRRVGARLGPELSTIKLAARAFALMLRPDRDSSDAAGEILLRAQIRQPEHPVVIYLDALRHFLRAVQLWEYGGEAGLQALGAVRKAFAAGQFCPQLTALAGLIQGRLLDEAEIGADLIEKALTVMPSMSVERAFAAAIYARCGELDLAERHFHEYKRLAPLHPLHHLLDGIAVLIDLLQGRTELAAERGRALLALSPFLLAPALPCLAAFGLLGLQSEADRLAGRIESLRPGLTVAAAVTLMGLRRASDQALVTEGLRLAGLGEKVLAVRELVE